MTPSGHSPHRTPVAQRSPVALRCATLPSQAQQARAPLPGQRDALRRSSRSRVGEIDAKPWARCATKIEDAIDDHCATHLCARGRGRIDHDIGGAGAALALAAWRRTRNGEHARTGELAALRNLSCRSQGEVLRALLLALEHLAAIAVRRAAAGKI